MTLVTSYYWKSQTTVKEKTKEGKEQTARTRCMLLLRVHDMQLAPMGSLWWKNSLVLPVLRKTLCHFRTCKENNICLFIHQKILTDSGGKVPRGLFHYIRTLFRICNLNCPGKQKEGWINCCILAYRVLHVSSKFHSA